MGASSLKSYKSKKTEEDLQELYNGDKNPIFVPVDLTISSTEENKRIESFKIQVNVKVILEALSKEIVKSYTDIRAIELKKDEFGFWLFIGFSAIDTEQDLVDEFLANTSKNNDGFLGFRVHFRNYLANITISLSDYFYVGEISPTVFIDLYQHFQSISGYSFDEGESTLHDFVLPISKILELGIEASEPNELVVAGLLDTIEPDRIQVIESKNTIIYAYDVHGPYGVVGDLPFEVLEDREFREDILEVDRAIRKGEYFEFGPSDTLPLVMWRRLAIFKPMDKNNKVSVDASTWLEREPDCKLFLSYAVKNSGDSKSRIELVKQLEHALTWMLGDLEASQVFQTAFLEFYGNLSLGIDLDEAVAFYDRILVARPFLTRILLRKYRCLRKLGDKIGQTECLDQLVNELIDPISLAEAYSRLSRLLVDHDLDRAIELGKEALRWDRSCFDAAFHVGDMLVSQERYLEGIQVLDDLARTSRLKGVKGYELGRIEIESARIWLEHLNRSDMAITRVLKALEYANLDLETLGSATAILEQHANKVQKIKGLQFVILAYLDLDDDYQSLLKINDLRNLFTEEEIGFEKIGFFYDKYIEKFTIDIDHLEQLFEEDKVPLNWENIVNKLGAISQENPNHNLSRIIGMVYEHKLNDREKSNEHRLGMLRDVSLPFETFMSLISSFENQGMWEEVYQHLDTRRVGLSAPHILVVLRKMLSIGKHLPPIMMISPLLELMKYDDDSSIGSGIFMKELLIRLAAESDYQSIVDTMTGLISNFEISDTTVEWLEYAVSLISSRSDPPRYQALDWLYTTLLDSLEEGVAITRRALNDFIEGPPELYGKYLCILIQYDEIPDVDRVQVEFFLTGNFEYLGRYYLCMANSSTDRDGCVQYYRNAINQFKFDSDLITLELVSFAKIGVLTPLHDLELERFIYLAKNVDKISEIQGLKAAFLHTLNREYNSDVFDLLISRYQDLDLKNKEISDLFNLNIANADNDVLATFQMVDFFISNVVSDETIFYIGHLIDNKELWNFPSRMEKLLSYVFRGVEDKVALKDTIKKMVLEIADNSESLFLLYEEILSDLEISDYDLIWKAFKSYVNREDFQKMKDTWFRLTSFILNSEHAISFLATTEDFLKIMGKEKLLIQILEAGVNGGFPRDLALGVRSEIRIYYGLLCFEYQAKNNTTFEILKSCYETISEDFRVWIPLYMCYRDRGNDTEIFQYLQNLMLRIRKRPEALVDQPISLALLESEYVKLGNKLGHLEGDIRPIGILSDRESAVKMDFFEETTRSGIPYKQVSLSNNRSLANSLDQRVYSKLLEVAKDNSLLKSLELAGKLAVNYQAMLSVRGYERVLALFKVFNNSQDTKFTASDAMIKVADMVSDLDEIVADWRTATLKMQYLPGMTQRLQQANFENLLERHLALQCFALISGEFDVLDNHDMQVWRDYSSARYPFEIGKRVTSKMANPLLNSPIIGILRLLQEPMVRYFHQRFSQEHIATRAGLSPSQLFGVRSLRSLGEDSLKRFGFSNFSGFFERNGVRIFSLKGLGNRLYYEYNSRSFYLDIEHYERFPRSFLFHRLMAVFRSVLSGLYPLLKLDCERHILAFLNDARSVAKSEVSKPSKGSLGLRVNKPGFEEALAGLNMVKVDALFKKLGDVGLVGVKKVQKAVWVHLYMMQMAETLDLIGVSEAIIGKDFLREPLGPIEAMRVSDMVASLLAVAPEINLSDG